MKMRYLYRCVSIILAAVMLTVCAYADSAVYSKAERETYANNAALLQRLEILDSVPDITKTVTRGEYAKILMTLLLGECSISEETDIGFSDVGAEDENAAYIYQGGRMGLFSGNGDGTFSPDEMIKTEDAAASLVKTMGYKVFAEQNGGFPNGYMFTANQNGVFDGLNIYIGYELTYGTLVGMIINSFGTEFFVPVYTSGGISYEKGENGFLKRLGIERKTGVVTANKYTALTNDGFTAENMLQIDGRDYFVNEDYSELLGYKVIFYVRTEENGDEIAYIGKNSDMNREKVIAADALDGYSQRTYSYSDGDRNKELTLPAKISIIYNGVCAAEPTAAMMKPADGSLRFVDSNNDGKYDVLFISDYETWVVKSVNTSDKRIYGMDKTAYLDLSETDFVNIVDTEGKETELSELKKYNVLSVLRSRNGRCADITVSRSSVKGKIDSFGRDKIKIGGAEYKFSADSGIDSSYVGKNGLFLLNFDNRAVYFIDGTLAQMTAGFLINAGSEKGTLNPKMKIKLFSSDGNMITRDCAKRIEIDGVRYTDAEKAVAALKKGRAEVENQPVLYATDEDGNVSKIDTPYNSADNPNELPGSKETADSLRLLTKIIDSQDDVIWQNGSGIFNGKICTTNGFVLFSVPGNPKTASAREFSVTDLNILDEQPSCESIELYSTDSNNLIAGIGVMYGSSGTSKPGGTRYGVVTGAATVIDNENEVTEVVVAGQYENSTVFLDVNDATVIGMSDGETLHEGDFIEYRAGASGYVTWIDVLHRYNAEELNISRGAYWAKARAASGFVYSREDNVISVSADPIVGELDYSALDIQNLDKYKKILQYNSERNIVSQITADDICDWKSMGSECSKIIYCTDQGAPIIMVCYK